MYDSDLLQLTKKLRLRRFGSHQEWSECRAKVVPAKLEQHLTSQMDLVKSSSVPIDLKLRADFDRYESMGSIKEYARLIVEGRLGYYEKALPAIATIIQRAPRANTIVDLGCQGGLSTLYFARKFPQAAVLGLDASTSWIERALEAREICGVDNASFRVCDYTKITGEQYHVAVSLMSMPTWSLPQILAKGKDQEHWRHSCAAELARPSSQTECMAEYLRSVRCLLQDCSVAIINERIKNRNNAFLFAHLLRTARMSVTTASRLTWCVVMEPFSGPQAAPLICCKTVHRSEDADLEALLHYGD